MSGPILRFAPSPNGRLHLGHAYSALLNDAEARRLGGTCLLRIEDIDPTRCRPELERAILADLAWLGLRYPSPAWRQSERMEPYRAAFATLRGLGLVYPCWCTRGEIARAAKMEGGEPPRDPDGAILYPGTCRHVPHDEVEAFIQAGRPAAWRLDMRRALAMAAAPVAWIAFAPDGSERRVSANPARWGDPVVVRRDVPTSYHLAVVVDDAAQAVTHVVRGADLEAATDLHTLLQTLLDLPTPRYHHHRLLRDAAGGKLSKSLDSPGLAVLRDAGRRPAEIRSALGF